MSGRSIRKRFFPLLTISVLMSALGSACGGTPYMESGDRPGNEPGNIGGGNNTGNSPLNPGFEPSYSFSFSDLTGQNGSKPTYLTQTVQTDSLLRVKITAGQGGPVTTPGYEEYNMNYGCIRYKIDLISIVGGQQYKNGESKVTKVLSVPGADNSLCPDAPSNETFDFSSRLGSQSGIKIRVSEARYDLYCQIWWRHYHEYYQAALYSYPMYAHQWATSYANDNAGMYYSACSADLKLVNKLHTVSGSIDIQVNGAEF